MLMFFLFAGATLEVERLPELGILGIGYVVLRILSRAIGGWLGGMLAGLPPAEWRWIGPALLPQAGVAVGMALVAGEAFPQWRDTILTLTVATTVDLRTARAAGDDDGREPDKTRGSEHRAGVTQPLKPLRRDPREALRHGLAPRAGELRLGAHAHDLRIIGIGEDEARVLGQKLHREGLVHGPEIPIGPFEIAAPFPVRGEIRPARLALHDPEFALGTHRHDIEPLAAFGGEFLQRGEAVGGQVPAHTACQKLPGHEIGRKGEIGIGHGPSLEH
jgi:hypothetical protein